MELTTGLEVNLHGGKNITGGRGGVRVRGRGRKQTRRKRLTVDKHGVLRARLLETGANSRKTPPGRRRRGNGWIKTTSRRHSDFYRCQGKF